MNEYINIGILLGALIIGIFIGKYISASTYRDFIKTSRTDKK